MPHLADDARLFRAMQSRDRRFEGSFIAGIRTTGIYCRPGCSAKMPLAKNVRFFACAAAAEEAGFRPCLRCRPDTSALLPAAAGSSATVSRALHLISTQMGEIGLAELCTKLGVGERHLRRLFVQHLGASPHAVLRSQRLRFARTLLEQTRLPMTEVALASGFGSTRRFNAELRRTFQASPTMLRKAAPCAARSDLLELQIPYAPPLDWQALLSFFRTRAIDGVEIVGERSYSRSVRLPGSTGAQIIEVEQAGRGHALLVRTTLTSARALPALVAGVRRMFGCDVQSHAVTEHLSRDPLLARALEKHPGLRVPGAWDPFELAVRALLGQQISVRAAQTLTGRLVRALGEPIVPSPPDPVASTDRPRTEPTHLFPAQGAVARTSPAALAKLGLMPARALALHELARAVDSGSLDFESLRLRSLDDASAALESLVGFGPWSAHYIAMRALSEPDAFPLRDLGLLRAIRREKSDATFADLRARAEAWRPFRATAAIALWLLDGETE